MAKKLHAVVIPYPLQGHLTPAAHLAIALASHSLTVTFVNTESIHHSLGHHHDNLFSQARASGLDIRYELVSDGLPISFDRSLNHDEYMHSILHVMEKHVEELFGGRLAGVEPKVSCLIADTFFVWPDAIAKKFGVMHVSFWTEAALVFSLYYSMDLLRQNGHFDCRENRRGDITYIPGVPTIKPSDLPSYLQATDTTSVVHKIIFKAFDQAKGADLILCNTVQEFEPSIISALNHQTPFYGIGPISTKPTVPTNLWAESDCIQWLDTKPASSVLYVSFGSYAHLSKNDLEEIAQGVMESGVWFIWAARPDIVSSDEPDPFPTRFLEGTCGRGLVVPWCGQVEVLMHKAIGGFLTHCGWNSILEGIWAEAPMLCFPLLTDQFTNRKLVVEEWTIGIDAGGVGRADREEMRIEIKKMRNKLENAVRMEGSSKMNLKRFIGDFSAHHV